MYRRLVYNGCEYGELEIDESGEMVNVRTGWKYVWYSTSKGYSYTLVHLCKGKKKRILQHRAVACTFIENSLGKPHINHKDGNKKNNHISNLEWCTPQENNKHAWDTGLSRCVSGEERGLTKLSKDQVMYLLDNYRGKDRSWGAKPLAKKFNVPVSVVYSIINGQTWIKFVKEYKNEKLQA